MEKCQNWRFLLFRICTWMFVSVFWFSLFAASLLFFFRLMPTTECAHADILEIILSLLHIVPCFYFLSLLFICVYYLLRIWFFFSFHFLALLLLFFPDSCAPARVLSVSLSISLPYIPISFNSQFRHWYETNFHSYSYPIHIMVYIFSIYVSNGIRPIVISVT